MDEVESETSGGEEGKEGEGEVGEGLLELKIDDKDDGKDGKLDVGLTTLTSP